METEERFEQILARWYNYTRQIKIVSCIMCAELKKKYFLGVTEVTPGPLLQTKVKLMDHRKLWD